MNKHEKTVAVITGGTQGLGLAIARRLVEEGCTQLVICGRNAETGAQAVAELTSLGADCRYVQADLAQVDDCFKVVDTAFEAFGRVNALVNSAATTTRGGLLDTDLARWEEHMNLNLRAPFLTMQRAVGYMVQAEEPGSIVNILSMSALCGQSFLTAYSTSKGGLATLTKNVANAFAKNRIRCNGIMAGWMETPGEDAIQRTFHGADAGWATQAAKTRPMGQLIQPEEVAGLASYLLSPSSGVITGSLIEYDQFVGGSFPE